MRRPLPLALLALAAISLTAAVGVGREDRPFTPHRSPAPTARPSPQADSPVFWVHADPSSAIAADHAASVASSLLTLLIGQPIHAAVVDDEPPLSWHAAPHPTRGFRLGLDLSALRRDQPDLFSDQTLNDALLALGLANARGLVIDCDLADARGTSGATLTAHFSFRDWDADRSESLALSAGRAPRAALTRDGRLTLRPRWTDWIDACLAARRARLDPLQRSPFEAELASWRRRHEPKLRQVTSSLEGPIVIGGDGGEPLVLVGVGPRADLRLLNQNLSVVLAALGEVTYDARSAIGTLTIDALGDSALAHLEWRPLESDGRRWILITASGKGDSIARGMLDRLRE